MPYLDWNMTLKRIQQMITPTSPSRESRTRRNLFIRGKPSRNFGYAAMKATPIHQTNIPWIVSLQIAVRMMIYTLLQQRKLQKPKRLMQPYDMPSSAMQCSTKDLKSGSLRTRYVSARKVGWLSALSRSMVVQLCGTITICNTLDILVSRRQ